MVHLAATIFAALAVLIALFQFALLFGAPWGHLAISARFPGRFPWALRMAALVQALLLLLMANTVLGFAWQTDRAFPPGVIWVIAAVMAISFVVNALIPSRPERRLWAPVTFIMFVCILVVVWG